MVLGHVISEKGVWAKLRLRRVVVGQEQGKLWVAYWSLSLIKLFTKRVRGSTGVTGGVGDR